jgi:hypothetical protein
MDEGLLGKVDLQNKAENLFLGCSMRRLYCVDPESLGDKIGRESSHIEVLPFPLKITNIQKEVDDKNTKQVQPVATGGK